MGPLDGFRIVEVAGIGPSQLCGMLLAEMGARVLRITRLEEADSGVGIPPALNLMNRSRTAVPVDLKRSEGVELVLQLCESADALFEGFRPGVMERLGLGPDVCLARNPRLVYGRVTGWGQEGPLAGEAGHDANYLALVGALACIGEDGRPPVLPLNLVADFGGGALYLAMGMLAGLLEAGRSGRGQVVDAAMVDGVASMMTLVHGMRAAGSWRDKRGSNLLDGGAPFMRAYETRDGRYVTVAALEPRFYRRLLQVLAYDDVDPDGQMDVDAWPALRKRLESTFKSRSRDQWRELLQGEDLCFAPVLTPGEAPDHPHLASRGTFQEVEGVRQPAAAPRFSRTPSGIAGPPRPAGEGARQALLDWGLPEDAIARCIAAGVLRTD